MREKNKRGIKKLVLDSIPNTDSIWLQQGIAPRVRVCPMLHFVGFTDPRYSKDLRYSRAVAIFGQPDFLHRRWDIRAAQEIAPGDDVVFATGTDADAPKLHCYDDSAHL